MRCQCPGGPCWPPIPGYGGRTDTLAPLFPVTCLRSSSLHLHLFWEQSILACICSPSGEPISIEERTPLNKSSSFVQEQCSHWLEGWLELWLPLGRKLRKQIKGKWWAALSSWEAWGGGGGGGGGDSPHILSHPCWLRVQIFWDELTPSG